MMDPVSPFGNRSGAGSKESSVVDAGHATHITLVHLKISISAENMGRPALATYWEQRVKNVTGIQPDEITNRVILVTRIEKATGPDGKILRGAFSFVARTSKNPRRPQLV